MTHVTHVLETVEGLGAAECVYCYAMISTVIKSVRTSCGDSRLVGFSYVIGFVMFVDVCSWAPSKLQSMDSFEGPSGGT